MTTYADEDWGYNCGTVTYKDGKIIKSNLPKPGSVEAIRLGDKIWNYDEKFKAEMKEEFEAKDYIHGAFSTSVLKYFEEENGS